MSFNRYSDYASASPDHGGTSLPGQTGAQAGSQGDQQGMSAQDGGHVNAHGSAEQPNFAQSFLSNAPFGGQTYAANMNMAGNPAQAFRGALGSFGTGNGHLQSAETTHNPYAYYDTGLSNPLSMQSYGAHMNVGNSVNSTGASNSLYNGLSLPSVHPQSMHSHSVPQLQQQSSNSGGSASGQQEVNKYAYLQMQAAKHYGYTESPKSLNLPQGATQQQQQQGAPSMQSRNSQSAHVQVQPPTQSSKVQQPSQTLPQPAAPKIPMPTIPTVTAAKPASSSTPPAAKKQKVAVKRSGANFSKKLEAKEDLDSEEEYNMDGMKTKSGRKVHKPSQFNPSKQAGGKRRGGPAKKPALDSLFCKVCWRGHSPKSNMIVFCDGCNEPYHQLCHLPVIDSLLITLPDAEWFCVDCDEKRGKRPLEMGASGDDLTLVQKKTYLASLPTSQLVELVLTAAREAPQLRLFAPKTKEILDNIHAKQQQAIAEERSKLLGQEYGPGDEYVPPVSAEDEACNVVGQPPMEQIVVRALQTLAAPGGSRIHEIIQWIERNYSMQDPSFKMKIAQQTANCVRKGRFELVDENLFKFNPNYRATVKVGPAALSASAQNMGGRAGTRQAGETGAFQTGHSDGPQMYPQGAGIQVPAESAATDGFNMVDTDSPAFRHQVSSS